MNPAGRSGRRLRHGPQHGARTRPGQARPRQGSLRARGWGPRPDPSAAGLPWALHTGEPFPAHSDTWNAPSRGSRKCLQTLRSVASGQHCPPVQPLLLVSLKPCLPVARPAAGAVALAGHVGATVTRGVVVRRYQLLPERAQKGRFKPTQPREQPDTHRCWPAPHEGAGATRGAHIPKARPGLSRTLMSGSQPARGKGAQAGLWGPRSTPLGPELAGAVGRAQAAPGPAGFRCSQGSKANKPVDFWGLPALSGWSQSQAPRADVLSAAARPMGTQTRSCPQRLPAHNSTDPPGPGKLHPS